MATTEKKNQTASFSDVTPEMLQFLAQVGLVASGKGMFSKSREIFTGVQAVRPESDEAIMARAMSLVFSGKLKEPADMLAEVADRNPSNDLARSLFLFVTFLGKAYPTCKTLAQDLIKRNGDPEAVKIAKSILEEIQQKNLAN